MSLNRLTIASAVLAVASLTAACGDGSQIHGANSGTSSSQNVPNNNGPANAANGSNATSSSVPDAVTPPREYYDTLFAKALDGVESASLTDAASQATTLWVNFGGASLTQGFDLGQSFILCNDSATVPAADLSPADQDAVVQATQQFFNAAGVNVAVTATKPASGDFTTIEVGGTYADLGCTGPSDIAGIAPLDAGNANKNDIGFAFTGGNPSSLEVAETVAHEAGHTFGLQHVTNQADIMYPVETSAITGFIDSKALLQQNLGLADASSGVASVVSGTTSGTTTAGTTTSGTTSGTTTTTSGASTPVQIPGLANLPSSLSSIPGLSQIASIGQLLPGLSGVGSGNILNVSSIIPSLQSLLPTGASTTSFPGLGQILSVIGLAGAANGQSTTPQVLAGILGAGAGQLNINSLLQGGGFANLEGALSQLQTLFAGGGAGALPGLIGGLLSGVSGASGTSGLTGGALGALGNLSSIPNLAAILGLGSGSSGLGSGSSGLASALGSLAGSTGGQGATIASLLKNLQGSAAVVNGNFPSGQAQALQSLLKAAYSQQFQQILSGVGTGTTSGN